MIIYFSEQPEAFIREQQRELLRASFSSMAFALRFDFLQYYLSQPSRVELVAFVYLSKENCRADISVAFFQFDQNFILSVDLLSDDLTSLQDFAKKSQVPWIDLSMPLALDPVKIPKPWGQEIWYTGVEVRGVSKVIAQGFTTPLPWVLALLPDYMAAGLEKKIILLKALNPLPDEVYGDLYFELHEKKQEVYVVTHVDEQAWNGKVGAIRLGFDNKKRVQYKSDHEFKFAYLTAVKNYEIVRYKIDKLLDCEQTKLGEEIDSPVNAATLQRLIAPIPEALNQQEQKARELMNSFSAVQPLQVGDVVTIPCFVPHALQHGVSTLEFQTPVYERKILSFAQKVLTQNHWDTEAALEKVLLDIPAQTAHRVVFVSESGAIKVEEIVSFDDFNVNRISLAPYTTYALPIQDSYALLIAVASSCKLLSQAFDVSVSAETALFLPHSLMSDIQQSLWVSTDDVAVQVLIASPSATLHRNDSSA